jgi:hypothetical protein
VTAVLRDVIDAAGPALAQHAVAHPPSCRFEVLERAAPPRRFVFEAVHEGYLMHYGGPRAFAIDDHDLRLLAGDALYALGLSRLAEANDLEAVAELSDLITSSARAHAEGRAAEAAGLWEASARVLAGLPR